MSDVDLAKICLSSFYFLKASQPEKCLRQNCKYNATLTTVTLKPCSNKNVEDNTAFLAKKVFNSDISPLLHKKKERPNHKKTRK